MDRPSLGQLLSMVGVWAAALLLSNAFVGPYVTPGVATAEGKPVTATGTEGDRDTLQPVRVMIASSVDRVRVRCKTAPIIVACDGKRIGTLPAGQWHDASLREIGGIRLATSPPRAGGYVKLSTTVRDAVELRTVADKEWSQPISYPGLLRFRVRENGDFDVINVVDIETYVAAVVAQEVWPTFHDEALRAQAVAARTFVLFHMQRRKGAAFDVAATQGAQVYRGLRDDTIGRRAAEAASYTRGVVLTYRADGKERLVCAYYCAACGGMSQSAAIFGSENDIEPLSGGVRCDFCRIAPGDTYRWGPVRIPLRGAYQRLIQAVPKTESLGAIRDVAITKRTPSGRPVEVRIIGSSGQSYEMLAERFRLILGGGRVRSTDCRLRVRDGSLVFDKGKGFGHGLGMCQWGAQGQAQEGRRADEILHYYYPGAEVTRVY